VTGQSAAIVVPEAADRGDIEVRTSAGTLRIASVRTPGAGKARLERLERSFGGIVAELAEQQENFAVPFRAELSALAGGELPVSVQVIAQLAVMAVTTVRKAELLSNAALGDWSEARLDALACETLHERADKSQRNMAGLAIVARDLLQSARAAAREAGESNRGSPTEQLLTRLGVGQAVASPSADQAAPLTQTAASSDPVPPFDPGGGSVVGPPPSESPTSPKGSE